MPDSPTCEPESDFVCDCEEQMRSACSSEEFYKTHDGKSYCVLHFPGQEKGDEFPKVVQRKLDNKDFNFRGTWFPEKLYFTNFRFGAQVDFSYATFLDKVDFGGALFSAQAYFRFAEFKADADFRLATFSGETNFYSARFGMKVDFANASFRKETKFDETIFDQNVTFAYATFEDSVGFSVASFIQEARFTSVVFDGEVTFNSAGFRHTADFSLSRFKARTDFSSVVFAQVAAFKKASFTDRADFSYSRFDGDADFSSAIFSKRASFSFAEFSGYASFVGEPNERLDIDNSSLDFQFARIERPDRVVFHTQTLRPHWFMNVNVQKFDFANIDWKWKRTRVEKEIQAIKTKNVSVPHQMLMITCAHLAANAEENHRYEEASKFRYMAMDAKRRERWRGFALWKLSWWYWLASGYGERVSQAFLVLLGIWFVAALLYAQVGFARWEPKLANEADVAAGKRDDVGAPLRFSRALTYSAGVMTLQKPEPRAATTAAQAVVLLETILGPVQAALLALAIRRKFMR